MVREGEHVEVDENAPNQEELEEEILEEEEEDEDLEDVEEEEQNEVIGYYRDVTRIFLARFDGHCQLEGCGEDIQADISEMIGVEIFSQETEDFERKHNDKPYWVCASHCLDEDNDDESMNDE